MEQYSVMENIELCTMFCSDELRAEDFLDDESADHNNLPVAATLRGDIIVTSHLRSVVDDNKLLLLERHISMGTPEHLHAISYICCVWRYIGFRFQ